MVFVLQNTVPKIYVSIYYFYKVNMSAGKNVQNKKFHMEFGTENLYLNFREVGERKCKAWCWEMLSREIQAQLVGLGGV